MSLRLPRTIEQSEGTAQIAVANLGRNDSGAKSLVVGGKDRRTLVMSVGNPFPYHSWGGFYQVHNFFHLLSKTDSVKMRSKNPITGLRWWCNGTVCLGGVHGLSLPTLVPSSSFLDGLASPYGAIGWNRTRPTREVASAAVALGELMKDGLPRLPGAILGDALRRLPMWRSLSNAGVPVGTSFKDPRVRRALGSEYLNYDFGWRPLVDDAIKLLNFQANVDERLRRWRQAGNGNTMRRRMVLKDETTVSSSTFTGNVGGYLAGCGSLGNWTGTKVQVDTQHDKIWFAAGYRLNIPDLSSPVNMAYTRAALLGGLPTLSAAYNLTPWSWLADWFGNYGDAIANVSDPLQNYFAATHAFVMFQRTVTRRVNVTGTQSNDFYGGPHTVSVGGEHGSVYKYRKAASPFGFGSTWGSLSANQIATAAALGISRA